MRKASICFLFLIVLVTLSIFAACSSSLKPVKLIDGSYSVSVKAVGEEYNNGLSYRFDGEEKNFQILPNISSGIHDCYECSDCGYTEFNGKQAYHICADSRGHNGFLFKFSQPIKAEFFSGATIEYMTSKKTKDTEIVFLRADAKNTSNHVNKETFVSEGHSDWDVTNVGIDDFSFFADDKGMMEGFHFFVRSSEYVDFYITDITFKIDAEKISSATISSCGFYEKGAVETVANQIKENFENANLGAEIKVECDSYLQNTSKDDGEITYNVEITMSNGRFFSYPFITKKIPHLENTWLENENSHYGAAQSISNNWEKSFSTSGVLSIEGHDLSCAEGIKNVQYTVIFPDTDYKSDNVQWHDVQKLVLSPKGIKSMYINSFLDYGSELKKGQDYLMVVRGVSNNNNYIKHLEKSFKYNDFSVEKNTSIINAFEKIKQINLSGNGNVSEQFVKESLEKAINDTNVSVVAKLRVVGGSSSLFDVSVTYSDKEASACIGDAFTIEGYRVLHTSEDANKAIQLVLPHDGQSDIILATDYIYKLSTASYDEYTNVAYGYLPGENCTPPPVRLEWTDSEQLGDYKIFVSESIDFNDSFEFATNDNYFELYNLKVGTKYYWKVSSGSASSSIFSFETKTGYPRFIKADKVSNMRDIGGYITQEGKIVKQGLVYRSGSLDALSSSSKKNLAYQLQIKTDLDLRGKTNAFSPLGKDVNYIPKAVQWYHGIFDEDATELIAESVKLFADESNYPIDFHCSLGRDRTGTLSILLLGLLGVDEETILREYHFSFFSETGMFSISEFLALQENLKAFDRHLSEYGAENATFNQRIEAFLLDIGVTSGEINKIREILLADAPVSEKEENNVIFEDDSSNTFVFVGFGILFAVVAVAVVAVIIILKKRRGKKVGEND